MHRIGSFQLVNYLAETYTKVHPSEDILLLKILEKSRNSKRSMEAGLRESSLSAEEKELLLLNLDRLLQEEFSYMDELNERADKFIETYPESPYLDYVRHHINYRFIPCNWGINSGLYGGYGILTGALRSYYSNNAVMGMTLGALYKKFELNFRFSVGLNSNSRDMAYSTGIFTKGSPTRIYFPEVDLSYAILENHRFKVSPYAGIGFINICATKADIQLSPELEELNMTFGPTYTVGLCFDIKLGGKTPEYMPKTNYCFLRIRYSYTYAGSEKRYRAMSGGMHYITLGFGINCRYVKRIF